MRCKNIQFKFYFTAKSLYTFRVSFAPIIRSYKTVVTATGTSYTVKYKDIK